jgi:cytoskeletal protein CcmA (bactofilin family)
MGWKFYNSTGHLLTAPSSTASADLATEATNVTVTANNSEDADIFPVFVDGVSGTRGIETDSGFTYNPSSGLLVIAGELDAGSLDVSGNADIDGTLEADVITIDGTNVITGNLITTLGTVTAGTWEGTTVAVNQGGTGATSLTDGGVLLGSSTSAITAMSVLADSEMIVGDGSTDPVAESGATLRTSVGVGTGDSPTFTGLTLSADIDMQGANIDNGGVLFLKEQADADADVAGSGQLWVDTATPNVLYFTDDAGTDFNLSHNIRYIFYRIIAAGTDVDQATTVGGDFEFPFAGTIIDVGTFSDTAGITGTQIVDIHKNGTTIMGTHKCDTETTEKTTRDATQQPVITVAAIAEGDILTFDVDTEHSGTEALGLTVRIEVRVT